MRRRGRMRSRRRRSRSRRVNAYTAKRGGIYL